MTGHVLIAHDLRSTADLALRRAAQIARQHDAKLTLLHVFDPKLGQAERERIEQTLDRSLTEFAPSGSQLRLCHGKPAEGVLEQVQQSGADLLVLGAHHQRHEFFSGTTLDRIARRCPVPLLLAARDEDRPYRSAVAAIDFSLCACTALHQACLLLPSEASIHALHVFEPQKNGAVAEAELRTQRALIDQLLHDEALRLPPDVPTLSHEVRTGSILRTLQEYISGQQPQLLVLGSHGRSALSQALLGSLAQHYLHKAPCDVFVVR
ncbi:MULTISPECIES: universal stress protein [unclassified Pseudomonas]|uniref:universal stress protein n=1 Tax=unclassified Pseudomonas TaxID=196821 RepID=UPI0024485508|nr:MULTISPECIES: universal stress protein [unclassified Pseudomonas]MDG9925824.1 universal stress protein [Pseudomonas sp. GD04045]MDH0034936.1 universal stress protein [Pseudomonas sp. GD04019]